MDLLAMYVVTVVFIKEPIQKFKTIQSHKYLSGVIFLTI